MTFTCRFMASLSWYLGKECFLFLFLTVGDLVELMILRALVFFDLTALLNLVALGALVVFDLMDLFNLVVFLSICFGEIEKKESLGSGLKRGGLYTLDFYRGYQGYIFRQVGKIKYMIACRRLEICEDTSYLESLCTYVSTSIT